MAGDAQTTSLWGRPIDFLVPFSRILRANGGRPEPDVWPRVLTFALPTSFFAFWLFSFIPYVGTFAYMLILVPLAIVRHLHVTGTADPWFRVALVYYVVILIGFGGVWSFVGHTFMTDYVASQIGWPAGSPFQIELAFATLGAAFVGLLAIWIRDHMITGLVVAKSVFWLGAAGVHVWDAVAHHNFSPLNVGPPLVGDLLFPALLLWLLWLDLKERRHG